MNKENLKGPLSPSEARENGAKGGRKSGEVRRRKRKLKEAMEYILYQIKVPEDVRDILAKEGIDEKDFTHTMVITRSLIVKAESGDVGAYNAIRDILGEKPDNNVNLNIPSSVRIEIVDSGCDVDFASSEEEVDASR